MTVLRHFRLLPLLVLACLLSFAVRIGDFAGALSRSGSALASPEEQDSGAAAQPPPLPAHPGENKSGATAEPEKTPEKESTATAADGKPSMEPATPVKEGPESVKLPSMGGDKIEDWKDAGDEEFAFSPVQADLYKDLAARREVLAKREKELATREALLKAGERELEQKLRELTTVRNEIQALMKAQTDEEKSRIRSLVTIYEGMKAKDAARIFNTLDLDVLITVLTHMSERKSAPILAEMSPDRARTVTIMMAQQQEQPGLPE